MASCSGNAQDSTRGWGGSEDVDVGTGDVTRKQLPSSGGSCPRGCRTRLRERRTRREGREGAKSGNGLPGCGGTTIKCNRRSRARL